jgi:hypothetical protein
MYFVVYCLTHPYHENSDVWILDVYQDENTAKEIVENLNKAFDLYLIRKRKLLNQDYKDGFKVYRDECKMTNDEIVLFKSIHSRSLEKYSFYDDDEMLEYRFEEIN